MRTTETHQADRRRAILAAAERVFDARGYAATTMDAVAKDAGLAKGSLYNYFKNKQDLFVQVMGSSLAEDEAEADRLVRDGRSAGERLCRMLDDWYERLGHHKRIGGLVLESWAAAARDERQGVFARMIDEMITRWRGRIAAIISQGVEAGEFRRDVNAQLAASLIMSLGDGAMLLTILGAGRAIDTEFLAAYKRSMLAVLTGVIPPAGEAAEAQHE